MREQVICGLKVSGLGCPKKKSSVLSLGLPSDVRTVVSDYLLHACLVLVDHIGSGYVRHGSMQHPRQFCTAWGSGWPQRRARVKVYSHKPF